MRGLFSGRLRRYVLNVWKFMHFWLLKTEPDEYSIDDLAAAGSRGAPWDGIRNYQARNYLRDEVKAGDQVFIYHSSCAQVGVAGVAQVLRGGHSDPDQFDPNSAFYDPKSSQDSPRWYRIELRFARKFKQVVPLARLKQMPELASMVLLRQGRLSVQPVTPTEWDAILEAAESSA